MQTILRIKKLIDLVKMIKFNADLGEGVFFQDRNVAYAVAPYIHMANISCGAHAGSEEHILETIEICLAANLLIGAHPSYPDRENFGRKSLKLPPHELKQHLLSQLNWLNERVTKQGGRLDYIKPHGALYLDMLRDQEIQKIVEEVRIEFSNKINLVTQYSAEKSEHYIIEAFLDRRYQDNGCLLSRTEKGAVFESSQLIFEQFELLKQGKVKTNNGTLINIEFETLCIHCDNQTLVEVISQLKTEKVVRLSENAYLINNCRNIFELVDGLKTNFTDLVLVPSYETIFLEFPKGTTGQLQQIESFISQFEGSILDSKKSVLEIPIYYSMDLEKTAELLNISPKELIKLHSETSYYNYAIGFLPGFAYLGDLPHTLRLPRKEELSIVPAKTLAIAEGQTAIYPLESPGGWHQIGKTPLDFFDRNGKLLIDYRVAQKIRFRSITKEEFKKMGGVL
jgi:5-oxoprolinase (ATP-hydrolysing) subunit A